MLFPRDAVTAIQLLSYMMVAPPHLKNSPWYWKKLLGTRRSKPNPRPFQDIKISKTPRTERRAVEPNLKSDTLAPVVQSPISYHNFAARKCNEILDNQFSGILNYIYVTSGSRYNTSELLLQYKDAMPGCDPVNFLNANDNNVYRSGVGPGQCVVFEFRRIQVRPTALCSRSPALSRTGRPIGGFVFQGWNARRSIWVVLLEALNDSSESVWFIDTGEEFSKFRILNTDVGGWTMVPIAIEAFEIHGSIRVMDVESRL
jgi:hypothetical protein